MQIYQRVGGAIFDFSVFHSFLVATLHNLNKQIIKSISEINLKISWWRQNWFSKANSIFFSMFFKNFETFSSVQGEWYVKDGIISVLQVVGAGFCIFSGLPTFLYGNLGGFADCRKKMKKKKIIAKKNSSQI